MLVCPLFVNYKNTISVILNKKHCNWQWCCALMPLWILLFQHEEVQFLENELENQKQKYQELASFTKSLLSAVRNNDLERQQVTFTVMVPHGQYPFNHHLTEMSNSKSTVMFRSSWPFYLSLQTRIGTWTWKEEPILLPYQQTCRPSTATPRRPGQAPWSLRQP